jgi:hypothetical protein
MSTSANYEFDVIKRLYGKTPGVAQAPACLIELKNKLRDLIFELCVEQWRGGSANKFVRYRIS